MRKELEEYLITDDAPIVTSKELVELLDHNPDKLFLIGFVPKRQEEKINEEKRRVIIYEPQS